MILDCIFLLLKNDITLKNLLGGSDSDCKIYPNFVFNDSGAPYIIYSAISFSGNADAIVEEEGVSIQITAKKFSDAAVISKRIKELLHQSTQESFFSGGKRIFYGRLTGGHDFADAQLQHVRIMNFNFKYIL